MIVSFDLDGTTVEVADDGISLLDALRGPLGVTSAKDGCSPQGQCGCCTVLVDGQARVACVTPVRRVEGRSVVTLDGLTDEVRDRWAEAFVATGASQCGFCTPGIVVRLEALRVKGGLDQPPAVERALAAHLCRCTGWQTITEAAVMVGTGAPPVVAASERDLTAAGRRASLEGATSQRVGADVVLGGGGFSADTAPVGALVAVPDSSGGFSVAADIGTARRGAARVQGRRTTLEAVPPIDLPEGDWDVTLRTSWVEPAYVETDASWCGPGGRPASTVANGGAFGAKLDSPLPGLAAELSTDRDEAVLVQWSREDATRHGPKRPPLAAGVRADGTGAVRVARTPGIVEAIRSVAPGFDVVEVDVAGPPTSCSLRAAGRAEAIALLASVGAPSDVVAVQGDEVRVSGSAGEWAAARVDGAGVHVRVFGGDALDDVVLRSYCIGAAHMAVSWVSSEKLSVAPDGEVVDLTIRSFSVLRASDTPTIDVAITPAPAGTEPVAVSDHVFCAVAAALWRFQGLPAVWPTGVLPAVGVGRPGH